MKHATFVGRALALALALAAGTLSAAHAQSVSIVLGGQQMYFNPGPIERAGRVFVPMRAIFEHMGATVVYSNGAINATKGRTTVGLQIGSTQATINGQQTYLDVAPFIIGATTYVPLRFIAQSLGAGVNYDDATRVVSIRPGNAPPPPNPRPPYPQPPPQVQLLAQQPPPGATTDNRFATIGAEFSRLVRPGTVRVWLDGADVTYRAGVYARGFSYKPPAPMGAGWHKIRVAGAADDGTSFDRAWSFNTAGAPPPAHLGLQNIAPGPGESTGNRFATISANFSAEVRIPSVRVWLDGADRTNQCGISRTSFSYKPPAPLAYGSHTVRVTGTGADGAALERTWSFTVTGNAAMHLTINGPAGDSVVGTDFTVRGNTLGNARVRVTAGATPSSTGLFEGSTTAGPAGNFSIRVSFAQLMGQQTVKVRIVATNPNTGETSEKILQLRIR